VKQFIRSQDTATQESYSASPEEEEMADFVSVVLAETEDVWTALFNDDDYAQLGESLVTDTNNRA
jgi:uncharacterized protein